MKTLVKTTPANRGIYQLQAEICKVMAHPVRLEVLHLVGRSEVSFAELLASLDVSKPNLSQHLSVLRKGRIITTRREGVNTSYRLTHPEIEQACHAVGRVLAKHLSEIQNQATTLLRTVAVGRRRTVARGGHPERG